MTRFVKQLIIGGIYIVVLLGIIWFFYRLFVPAPSCTDGIKNGNEDGVDCGALACGMLCPVPIQSLKNLPILLLRNSATSYDVLVHLENPNNLYGASRVDYVLTVTDASGAVLTTRSGNTYVNPAQPRYLLFPLTGLNAPPAKAVLQFAPTDVEWAGLNVDAKGDIQFGVRDDLLTPASGSLRYQGTVINQSKFNLDTVDITVLLYNSAGVVVGANSTVQRTLLAGDQRGFVVDWPFTVSGAVRAQTIVTTNIFANDNFIKAYGSQERFQGF